MFLLASVPSKGALLRVRAHAVEHFEQLCFEMHNLV